MEAPRLSGLRRQVIDGGYSKKGELATINDALALGLLASDADKIYICDRNRHLVMFHCKDDYETTETDADKIYAERMRISAIRGWIVNSITNEIVCRSFTETSILFTVSEHLTPMDWTGWTFSPYLEGTTIRTFWDGSEWLHATHRKIDFSNSKIPGAELVLKDIFKECLPNLNYDELDKTVTYVFHMVHQENQIMNPVPVPQPHIVHLTSFRGNEFIQLGEIAASVDGKLAVLANAVPGCAYYPDLILEQAQSFLDAGWCCSVRRGFEIVQLAAPGMEYLMRIRGTNVAPYIPVELMYLRLNPEDRPNLHAAVAYHLKEKAQPAVMESWISYNAGRLALFCAQNLDAKRNKNGVSLTRTLTWLLKTYRMPNDEVTIDQMHGEYQRIIANLIMTNGVTIYRCFRDMVSVMQNLTTIFQRQMMEQADPTPVVEQKKRQQQHKKSKNGNRRR